VLTVLHGVTGILVISDLRRPEGYSDLVIRLEDCVVFGLTFDGQGKAGEKRGHQQGDDTKHEAKEHKTHLKQGVLCSMARPGI
jgi:hypothetical protein